MVKKQTNKDSGVQDGMACAVLSYFLIGVIWYFVDEKMKKNKFARFHAQQGIALFVVYLAFAILSAILFFLFFIWWVVYLVLFVFWLIGLIRAIQGKMQGVPVIDKLAEKFKI